jgi:hypothetical protein
MREKKYAQDQKLTGFSSSQIANLSRVQPVSAFGCIALAFLVTIARRRQMRADDHVGPSACHAAVGLSLPNAILSAATAINLRKYGNVSALVRPVENQWRGSRRTRVLRFDGPR